MNQDGDHLLRIYLTDHLTGSRGGIDLAERCLKNNQESELGNFLKLFLKEIRAERETLKSILQKVGGSPSLLKETAVKIMEKIGGLKLNGSLLQYSDLSRLIELEGLLAGVRAKLDMWLILERHEEISSEFSIKSLVARGKRQLEQLQKHCLLAAARAFPLQSEVSNRRDESSKRRRQLPNNRRLARS